MKNILKTRVRTDNIYKAVKLFTVAIWQSFSMQQGKYKRKKSKHRIKTVKERERERERVQVTNADRRRS